MELWQQILVLILTPTTVIVVVTYFLRKFFELTLSRDLEKFKTDLQMKQSEFQTRFSLLHEKRIQVIGELYALLAKSTQLTYELVHPFQFVDSVRTLPIKKSEAIKALNELHNYFLMHRIYLDKTIAGKMDVLIEGTRRSLVDFSLAQKGEQYQPDNSGLWDKAWDKMEKEVSPLQAELERQFRELMEPKNGKTA